jgi:glycopeptide antibiotics resistance protein
LGRHTATEVIGNLALLAPLGAFGRLLRPGRPLLVLAAAAALSVAIEGFQCAAASGRVASTNFVLPNTAGAALGWAGARLVARGEARGRHDKAPAP